MNSEIEENTQRNELIKNAFVAGRDAIIETLGGHHVPHEAVLDVVQLMAHSLLTDSETLGLAVALHNAELFSDVLKKMIETTQANVEAGYAGRLM